MNQDFGKLAKTCCCSAKAVKPRSNAYFCNDFQTELLKCTLSKCETIKMSLGICSWTWKIPTADVLSQGGHLKIRSAHPSTLISTSHMKTISHMWVEPDTDSFTIRCEILMSFLKGSQSYIEHHKWRLFTMRIYRSRLHNYCGWGETRP